MKRQPESELSPQQVMQRFRWARRRGTPAWLWPETAPEQWRGALHRIEGIVRGVLTGRADIHALEGDPEAIGLACYTSGVGPLLGWWRARQLFESSPEVAAVLDRHLAHNRQRAARMEEAAITLVEAFDERGISPLILKGAHTACNFFPDPGTRPASDIDLLIHPAATGQMEEAMGACGYICAGRGVYESNWRIDGAPEYPKSLRLVHKDDPWSVDIHTSLNVPFSAGGPVAKLDAAEPLASTRSWSLSSKARTLEQPLLLLHLAVHAGAGLQNLTLLRLVELHFVTRRDMADGLLSWKAFVGLGQRTGSLGFAWPALKLCEDLVPTTVPDDVLRACLPSVPPAVRRVVEGLGPATAQRVDRASIAEHFMWASGVTGWLRQAASDIAPSGSWNELWLLYQKRMWQLLRGRLTR